MVSVCSTEMLEVLVRLSRLDKRLDNLKILVPGLGVVAPTMVHNQNKIQVESRFKHFKQFSQVLR